MRRRVLLGIAAMAYSRGVVTVIQLLLVPTLALNWGLAVYGQWLMLSSVPVFLAASDFGFSTTAGMRLIGEVAAGRPDEARTTFWSARRMITLLCLTVFVGASAIVWLAPARVFAVEGGMSVGSARVVLTLLCLYSLLAMQGPLFGFVARAVGRTAQVVACDSTAQLGEALAVMVLAMTGYGPLSAAIAYLVVRLAGIGALVVLARGSAPWLREPGRWSRTRIRQMWRPALAAMALPLAQAAQLQGAAIAVGAAAGAATVPIFTTLRTLSRIGLQAAFMLAVPLMPEYAAARARHDDHRAGVIAGALAVACFVLGLAYALVLAGFGSPLLALWTKGTISPPSLMITLTAIGIAVSVLWNPLGDLLIAVNRHEAFAYVYAVAAALSVALTYAWVRRFGVSGAAAAGLALDAAMLIVVVRSLSRHGGRISLSPATLMAIVPPRWRSRPRQ